MNTINLVLTRCLVLALILLSSNLKAATYQTFEELIDNESLILSVDEGTLEEYGVIVESILVKSESGSWSFSDFSQAEITPAYDIILSANGGALTQTYIDKSHGIIK